MIKLFSCQGKKIGIYGLSRTGVAACKALNEIADLIVYDDSYQSRQQFLKLNIKCQLLNLDNPKWQECDAIIVSPGIPLYYPNTHLVAELAARHNIVLKTDIDFLYNEQPDSKYIAITGTNGKSTTTALLAHILSSLGRNFEIGGNIGKAVLSLSNAAEGYILELSSFQLDLIKDLRLDVAILLNVTPDHLDRYQSMQQYVSSKEKIFSLLKPKGCGFIDINDPINQEIYLRNKEKFHLEIIPSIHNKIFPQLFCRDKIESENESNIATWQAESSDLSRVRSKLYPETECSIVQQNIDAAYKVAQYLGYSIDLFPEIIKKFQPLKHRMQYLGHKGNIYIYNDSKATNIEATVQSLAILKNIYWLAGGIAKARGISSLNPLLLNHINKAYLYGQSRNELAIAIQDKIPVAIHDTMEDAFNNIIYDIKNTSNLDKKNILLSPACASYDQFKNYEDRGEKFIELSYKIIHG